MPKAVLFDPVGLYLATVNQRKALEDETMRELAKAREMEVGRGGAGAGGG